MNVFLMSWACDIQGTYEVNMLIAAREVTGIAAFKPRIQSTTNNSRSKL